MKFSLFSSAVLLVVFLRRVAAQDVCHEPVDVAVVLDFSAYFGSQNFVQLKEFSKDFARYFQLTDNGLNSFIAFIPYSNRVIEKSVINFRYSSDHPRLARKIEKLNFDGSWGTRLDLALSYAREKLFTANKGSRAWVPHVVLAITGSLQYWNSGQKASVTREAALLKKTGIQLLIASVGPSQGNEEYLKSLVGSQDDLYTVTFPYLLYGISGKISKQVCPVPSTFACPGKVDIAFIVDSSGSISNQDYNKMKYFMFSIAKAVNISAPGAHAGIVIYSKSAEMVVKFDDHADIAGFRDVVYNLKHMKSFTRIDLGLAVAHAQLFSPIHGGARAGVKKIAFILTDGKQTSIDGLQISLRRAVQPLFDSGVKTLSIGIGPAVEKNELRAMVSRDEDVIRADNFDELIKSIQNITQLTCEEITITQCKHSADIVSLLDSSSGVNYQDLLQMKYFTIAVEKRFRISEYGNKHGVILFGNRAVISLPFNGENSTTFAKAVKRLSSIGGQRASYRALELAEAMLYDFGNGARRNVPKVIVLMVAGQEGRFSDMTYLYQAAKRARDKGVVVIVVGIGSGLTQNTLLPVVGSSSKQFYAQSIKDLKDEASPLSASICASIEPVVCDKVIDIAFILDSSGSIVHETFFEMKTFVRAMAETFTITRGKTHVALMIYSNEARIMATFNEIQDPKTLAFELSDLPHLRGKTRIDLALKLAGAELFTGKAGMRWSTSVPKVAMVITDGRQSPAADAIRLDEAVAPLLVRGVKVLAIGVGNKVDRTELELMVRSPELAYWAETYQALRLQLAAIAKESCQID